MSDEEFNPADLIRKQDAEEAAERERVVKALALTNEELDRHGAEPMPEAWTRVRALVRAHADKVRKLEDELAGARLDQLRLARKRLPNERQSATKKFKLPYPTEKDPLRVMKGYATVGVYPDGRPGELFIVLDKSGTSARGYADAFATITSIALQCGVPLEVIAQKMIGTRFGPAGVTGDEKIPMASSVLDYVFRWMLSLWGKKDEG